MKIFLKSISINLLATLLIFCIFSCKEEEDVSASKQESLFETLPSETTGVDFRNDLAIDELKTPMEYINVYNGGGVATGDINNDGLADIFFTGNSVDNKLYLNRGDFKFEDISKQAGIEAADSWCTGVTMADVNQDGWLDIYVCRSYHQEVKRRENLLFINNGDLSFTEMAGSYGIQDANYSIAASFFDYNNDNLPDLFVGNHPLTRRVSINEHHKYWKNPVLEFSDRLFKNNGDGSFTDVTNFAGVMNYGWTLGLITSDLNDDGWQDIYVAVDHGEPDRYYINNGKGSFIESNREKMKHISFSSMGLDAADINNDGLVDLTVVDMSAMDNFREKTNMASMDVDRFYSFVNLGYNQQFMRNMLHLNIGDGNFVETGRIANIDRTGWSWAPLLADLDNDGFKDLYVSNGYYKDFLNRDFSKLLKDKLKEAKGDLSLRDKILNEHIKSLPSTKLPNKYFKNNGDLSFSDLSEESGLDFMGFTAGAAYADLDLDGDLDMVCSNLNDLASLHRNRSRENGQANYIRIEFDRPNKTSIFGARVEIKTKSRSQFQEFTYTRGYQSSVEEALHFGLGTNDQIDYLIVDWPDGKQQKLLKPGLNQILELKYENATDPIQQKDLNNKYIEPIKMEGSFLHVESDFDDYAKQILLPHQMSRFGPFISVADINSDGLEDYYIGGASGQKGEIFIQKPDGQFNKKYQTAFEQDEQSEDMASIFFDADGDGDQDLYVVSGGNEFNPKNPFYADRLYLNDGQGNFSFAKNSLPRLRSSGSCIKAHDFDSDGDLDLFVGGRHLPWKYPSPVTSHLLVNENGIFSDKTEALAPELIDIGMVTDAVWSDVNGDGAIDLMLCGEWMSIRIFLQKDGSFSDASSSYGLDKEVGWWNSIAADDLDGDGDTDFVIGNLGLNYKYKASHEKPFHVFGGDFDNSGSFDIALGYYFDEDVLYPVRGRQCSSEQIPEIADKFENYESFAKASIFDIYGPELENAIHYKCTNYNSVILWNDEDQLKMEKLPNEVQLAPINAILIDDFNKDGMKDLLVAGNLYSSEIETGRADAGTGCLLLNIGNKNFKPLSKSESGFYAPLDVKDMKMIKDSKNQKLVIVANNNDKIQYFKVK